MVFAAMTGDTLMPHAFADIIGKSFYNIFEYVHLHIIYRSTLFSFSSWLQRKIVKLFVMEIRRLKGDIKNLHYKYLEYYMLN